MATNNATLVSIVEEKFRTHRDFGIAMGWSDSKTAYKLKSFKTWTQSDIDNAIVVLGINPRNVHAIFFNHTVQES